MTARSLALLLIPVLLAVLCVCVGPRWAATLSAVIVMAAFAEPGRDNR